jgi:hypothetical protein
VYKCKYVQKLKGFAAADRSDAQCHNLCICVDLMICFGTVLVSDWLDRLVAEIGMHRRFELSISSVFE